MKIVQIAGANDWLYALTDDGSVWKFTGNSPNPWMPVPSPGLSKLAQIEKIIDDHTDYEGPMPGTGGYVGGVDPGALDAIVDLLRPR